MKILSAEQTRQLDRYTIQNEPIASINLMERASNAFVRHFVNAHSPLKEVHIICGPGNNGGDGLAIARILSGMNYRVHCYLLIFTNHFSEDHKVNRERLNESPAEIHMIESAEGLPSRMSGVIVDAMFGSGLNKSLKGLPLQIAEYINQQPAYVVSVDIPSGMFSDTPPNGEVVRADMVYTFQMPKLVFMMAASQPYLQDWKAIDIGLSRKGIEDSETNTFYTTLADIRKDYLKRDRFSHKGSHGHALILAGSRGKAGAAVLAAMAALRSGLGLLTVHIPVTLTPILQTAIPEAMCSIDKQADTLSAPPELAEYDAIGTGPGIGTSDTTLSMLTTLLKHAEKPMVLDADALNLLSANKSLLDDIPLRSILTPHPGEFKRLAGEWKDDAQKLSMQLEFSAKHHLIVVLKGAYTSITCPEGNVYFNSTGNHGMATAGSGDTLTGILTGLLAQGYEPVAAARTGVLLHGLAGDLALGSQHPNTLIASDITSHLGDAFNHIDPVL